MSFLNNPDLKQSIPDLVPMPKRNVTSDFKLQNEFGGSYVGYYVYVIDMIDDEQSIIRSVRIDGVMHLDLTLLNVRLQWTIIEKWDFLG